MIDILQGFIATKVFQRIALVVGTVLANFAAKRGLDGSWDATTFAEIVSGVVVLALDLYSAYLQKRALTKKIEGDE